MAKPPPSTPHSDLKGVDMDRRPQNSPANADPDQHHENMVRKEEAIGRPKDDTEAGRG